jgi:tocopherol cyclase
MERAANIARRWRALWNPDMYHGWGRHTKFFEGWYFKLIDPAEQHALAVIPGISKGFDGYHHSFIQVMDGKRCVAHYHDFGAEDFKASGERFEVSVGPNLFSAEGIKLDLPGLKGELHFHNRFPWPKMLGAPGIMGWYSFVPFMECYHGVLSMNHDISGSLEVDGQNVDFGGGKGYMEKDWGRSFPGAWIWMQTNHFGAAQPVSLMASVAVIPWLGSSFIGYIVGFLFEGKLYRFATYTGAEMKARLGAHEVYLSFRDKRHRLEIEAHQAGSAELVAPISGNMTGKVNESMQSTVVVRFYEGDALLFEGEGKNAGLELAGDVNRLLMENWRR